MTIFYECSKKENKLDIKYRNKKQTNKKREVKQQDININLFHFKLIDHFYFY